MVTDALAPVTASRSKPAPVFDFWVKLNGTTLLPRDFFRKLVMGSPMPVLYFAEYSTIKGIGGKTECAYT